MRRRRKVEPVAMVWTLALGFGAGGGSALAGLRRMYRRASGTSLVPSVFYDGFTPEHRLPCAPLSYIATQKGSVLSLSLNSGTMGCKWRELW